MTPMNNPMMAIIQMARSGGNPMALMQQMAGRNPQAAQVIQMVQGKNSQQLRSMAENMAKERGVNLEDVARNYGVTLPNK